MSYDSTNTRLSNLDRYQNTIASSFQQSFYSNQIENLLINEFSTISHIAKQVQYIILEQLGMNGSLIKIYTN